MIGIRYEPSLESVRQAIHQSKDDQPQTNSPLKTVVKPLVCLTTMNTTILFSNSWLTTISTITTKA